jgi:hypothetical protein
LKAIGKHKIITVLKRAIALPRLKSCGARLLLLLFLPAGGLSGVGVPLLAHLVASSTFHVQPLLESRRTTALIDATLAQVAPDSHLLRPHPHRSRPLSRINLSPNTNSTSQDGDILPSNRCDRRLHLATSFQDRWIRCSIGRCCESEACRLGRSLTLL